MAYRLGVDIGGTFTDIVLLDDKGDIRTNKLLSSPPDYSVAVETGMRELLLETGIPASANREFLYGTTVVANARTAYGAGRRPAGHIDYTMTVELRKAAR